MVDDHFYAVIMAGGGGTRLWPISRRKKPKQLLTLLGEKSFFQMCIGNLEGLIPPERIYVVTAAEQAAQLKQQVPQIPEANYFLEPQPRGNAAAVGLASVFLHRQDPKAVTAILAADIIFQNPAGFRSLLVSAHKAAQTGSLITLGIKPTYPATGYGYIELGDSFELPLAHPAHHVLMFKEKPKLDQAEQMMADGKHVWNSGLFIWQVERVLREYQNSMPELYAVLQGILTTAKSTPPDPVEIAQSWNVIQPQTIDFGIMEKAQDVVVLSTSGLGWSDIGCWDSLFEVLPGDDHGNVLIGHNLEVYNTNNSLIFSECERPVLVSGLQNLIVVDGVDSILVCARDESQKVKEVVKILKETLRSNYL